MILPCELSELTGEHKDDAIVKEIYVFTRAVSGAPVRPRKIISCILKHFGHTLEPFFVEIAAGYILFVHYFIF